MVSLPKSAPPSAVSQLMTHDSCVIRWDIIRIQPVLCASMENVNTISVAICDVYSISESYVDFIWENKNVQNTLLFFREILVAFDLKKWHW